MVEMFFRPDRLPDAAALFVSPALTAWLSTCSTCNSRAAAPFARAERPFKT